MSSEAYPWGLVRRLLKAWPELELGIYPSRGDMPQGYRGKRAVAVGGHEVAVEAAADLHLAVSRLDVRTGATVRRRYYEGKSRAPGELDDDGLIDQVWAALNRPQRPERPVALDSGRRCQVPARQA